MLNLKPIFNFAFYKDVPMRKNILVTVLMLFILSTVGFGQQQASYKCFTYDSETDTPVFENAVIDSNTNCLMITGAVSEKILEDIFTKVTAKEKIIKISLINYTDKSIPSGIRDFTNLSELTVINCPEIKYRKFFNQLHNLQRLNTLVLNDNESAEIPSTIKLLDHLKVLSIKNYDFVDADKLFKSISRMPSLRELTIASVVKLTLDINAPFPKSLKILNMSDNWLAYLPNDISKTSGLQSLDISENNFTNSENIVHLIEGLPLTSFKISCFDRRDSLLYIKALPGVDLHIAVYHELKKNKSFSTTLKEDRIPGISNLYGKTVKPIVGNPEISRKKYLVDTRQANTIVYPSGTVIKVPEEAFADAQGNAVRGEVTLYYREFNDILDIFANGVPMSYDSVGQTLPFRTAGMFEMYAIKDNQQVFLLPGKKIAFDFITADTCKGFNLYQLDGKKGSWNFKAPVSDNFKVEEKKYFTAYKLYENLFKINFDTTYFEGRYNDTMYARTTKIPTDYFKGRKKLLDPYFKLKRVYNYSNIKEIRKLPNFYMDIKRYSAYNELNVYKGWVWVYAGSLTKKEFGEKYITQKKWTDTRINYMPTENLFSIELKSPHETVSFNAFPVRPNYTTETSNYKKTYLKMDSRYDKAIKRIQGNFDKRIKKEITRLQNKTWDEICKHMSPQEKAMTKEEWIAYARKRILIERDSINKEQVTYANVTRSFDIDGFGIWNCDQIFRLKNPLVINAHFKDAFDHELIPSQITVIDGSNKCLLSTHLNSGETQIAIDMNSETALYIIQSNGSIAIVDRASVKNAIGVFKADGNYTFTAFQIDPMSLSTGELRKLVGFE